MMVSHTTQDDPVTTMLHDTYECKPLDLNLCSSATSPRGQSTLPDGDAPHKHHRRLINGGVLSSVYNGRLYANTPLNSEWKQ